MEHPCGIADGGPSSTFSLRMFTHYSFLLQELLLNDMEQYDAADGGPGRRHSVLDEGTDTRFETESDMMELCDLAEIL